MLIDFLILQVYNISVKKKKERTCTNETVYRYCKR